MGNYAQTNNTTWRTRANSKRLTIKRIKVGK